MGGGMQQMIKPLIFSIGGGLLGPQLGMASTTLPAWLGGASWSGMGALVAGGLGAAMFAEPPETPDFGSQFQFQSDLLDREQSFQRRSAFELEDLLENGSPRDKNLAFDELRSRGEDENVLREIEGRSTRSQEDQERLDQYILENPTPSQEDTRALAALFEEAGLRGLEEEEKDTIRQLEQKAADRGTLDSSRLDQYRLEQARNRNLQNLQNKQAGIDAATSLQTHEEQLRSANFGRLIKSGEFALSNVDAQLKFAQAERTYQQALRTAKTAEQRALAFKRFEADIDRQLAVYNQEFTTARDTGRLGLGITEAAIFRRQLGDDDDDAQPLSVVSEERTPFQPFGGPLNIPRDDVLENF